MDELNNTDKPITNQMRVFEHCWDGIGHWKESIDQFIIS